MTTPDELAPDGRFADVSAWPREQRWRQQTQPLPVVIALIRPVAGDRLLLIRRNEGPYTGLWALVGGKWQFGEELAAAIVREVKEESDLDAEFVALRAVVSERILPDTVEGVASHFLLFVCDLRVAHGPARGGSEGEVAWFTPAEIETLHESGAIIPSDHAMIRAYFGAETGAPVVEVEMVAEANSAAGQGVQMLRFDQHPLR